MNGPRGGPLAGPPARAQAGRPGRAPPLWAPKRPAGPPGNGGTACLLGADLAPLWGRMAAAPGAAMPRRRQRAPRLAGAKTPHRPHGSRGTTWLPGTPGSWRHHGRLLAGGAWPPSPGAPPNSAPWDACHPSLSGVPAARPARRGAGHPHTTPCAAAVLRLADSRNF